MLSRWKPDHVASDSLIRLLRCPDDGHGYRPFRPDPANAAPAQRRPDRPDGRRPDCCGQLPGLSARRGGCDVRAPPVASAASPARWLVAVRGADAGVVLGARLLVALAVALRHRGGERLGAGDDHRAESAVGRGGESTTAGRAGICRPGAGDFSHRFTGLGLAWIAADVGDVVADLCRRRAGHDVERLAPVAHASHHGCSGCACVEPGESRHRQAGAGLCAVRDWLHHPGDVPLTDGQRTIQRAMAGRSVLAVLRSGGSAGGVAGQPASSRSADHAALVDGDVVAASGRSVRLPVGQRRRSRPGRDPVRHAVSGVHATGDAALKGIGASRHSAQRRFADCLLRRRSAQRSLAGGAEQPFQRWSATGAGDRRLRLADSWRPGDAGV
ncbi:hypothetical protein [Pseudomonas fluorescens]|nr:hypothetical protein [Pseudomonas fluorescens]